MRIAQRHAEQPLSHGLDNYRTLAVRLHDVSHPHILRHPHRLAYDRKRFRSQLVARYDVIGCVVVTGINLRQRHKALDGDCACILNLWSRRGCDCGCFSMQPSLLTAGLFSLDPLSFVLPNWSTARRCATGTRAGPFLPRRFQLLVAYENELVLTDLIAAPLLTGFNRHARDGINQLMAQTIAGRSIDLPKGNPLRGADGGIKRDGTGHQREF